MKDWDLYLPSKWEEQEDVERRMAMEDAEREAWEKKFKVQCTFTEPEKLTKREQDIEDVDEARWRLHVMNESLKRNGRL